MNATAMKEVNLAMDPVAWMREASPYIRAHRGETFVVYCGGNACVDDSASGLAQDIVLLAGLGIKLVVVHGARPQIDGYVKSACPAQEFVGELRVTSSETLACVKTAVSAVRSNFEAQLIRAAGDAPLRGKYLGIAGGTYITARPAGVIDGVDMLFTGEVRRIHRGAIEQRLADEEIVLISPLAYSTSGEVYNLHALHLAVAVAGEIDAAKLLLLFDKPQIVDDKGATIRELTASQAENIVLADRNTRRFMQQAVRACHAGVRRVHLVDCARHGAILEELFTRDGVGTLISDAPFDQLRQATASDVGGVLSLIEPMENHGLLVKRSREKLEIDITRFSLIVRDGVILACGALFPISENCGELACIAAHPSYRDQGFGAAIVAELERRAAVEKLKRVFVLTTQAIEWFQEQGYVTASRSSLPEKRQLLYNDQRNSIVLEKKLD